MPTLTQINAFYISSEEMYAALQLLVDEGSRTGYILPGKLRQTMKDLELFSEQNEPFEGRAAKPDIPF